MACLETTFLIDILRRKESVRKLKDEINKTDRYYAKIPGLSLIKY